MFVVAFGSNVFSLLERSCGISPPLFENLRWRLMFNTGSFSVWSMFLSYSPKLSNCKLNESNASLIIAYANQSRNTSFHTRKCAIIIKIFGKHSCHIILEQTIYIIHFTFCWSFKQGTRTNIPKLCLPPSSQFSRPIAFCANNVFYAFCKCKRRLFSNTQILAPLRFAKKLSYPNASNKKFLLVFRLSWETLCTLL